LLVIASLDLPLHAIKFCSVVFGITAKHLATNTSSSSPVNNKRRHLTSDECHQLATDHAAECITFSGRSQHWQHVMKPVNWGRESQFLPSPPAFGALVKGPYRNVAITFGTEILEWCGYPMVTNFWRYVYLFWQNTWTWRTDGQTDGHHTTA